MVKLNLFTNVLESEPRRIEKRAVAKRVIPVADFLEVASAIAALREEILRTTPTAGTGQAERKEPP